MNDVNESAPRTPQQCLEAFKEGLSSVFRQWTALELAVDQYWGGMDSAKKADSLVNSVYEMFCTKKKLFKDEIVDFLEEFMELEFSAILEDDSPSEIAELLLDMFRQSNAGDFTLVTNALAREFARHEVLSRSRGLDSALDMDIDDDNYSETKLNSPPDISAPDDMMAESTSVTQEYPVVDADGWETVKRGKSTRSRK